MVSKMEHILASIFYGFWCQLASILVPKIFQNPIKNLSQKSLKFLLILGLIFGSFWLHFGTQVGAMLATFSVKIPKIRGPKSDPKRNPLQTSILERFGVDFAPF